MRKEPPSAADPRPIAGSLLQDEAIALAYALTAKAAEQAGVRALAIKGTASTLHGLRPARTPADVDILIDPDGFPAFSRQLEAWGWWIRLGEFTGFPIPHHSVTYIHDQWPCDIDAHRRFPGFLAPPDQVFDALWERRQLLPAAGQLVPMADWPSSVAIMALHSMRSTPDNPRHSHELRHLIGLAPTWTQQQRSDLAELARATGSLQSLDTLWPHLGINADPTTETVPAHDLTSWRLKRDGRATSIRDWSRYLRAGGPRQALRRLGTMLWPPETMMRATRTIPAGNLALFRARLSRLAKAVWNAPHNLLTMALGGHNVTRDALPHHEDRRDWLGIATHARPTASTKTLAVTSTQSSGASRIQEVHRPHRTIAAQDGPAQNRQPYTLNSTIQDTATAGTRATRP